MDEGRFPILIAEYKGADGRHLAERRRDAVVAALKKDGVKGAAERTQIGPVVGEWYPFALEFVARAGLFAAGDLPGPADLRLFWRARRRNDP